MLNLPSSGLAGARRRKIQQHGLRGLKSQPLDDAAVGPQIAAASSSSAALSPPKARRRIFVLLLNPQQVVEQRFPSTALESLKASRWMMQRFWARFAAASSSSFQGVFFEHTLAQQRRHLKPQRAGRRIFVLLLVGG
jgi:hypothetical protein